MGSSLVQLLSLGLIILASGMTGSLSVAQEQPIPAEVAPLGKPLPASGGPGTARAVVHGEYVYESNDYVFHQPVNYDREIFEITPGRRGQAVFVKGAVVKTVELNFKLTMMSPSQPGVYYWVYRESNSPRLWAFQTSLSSYYGYGIFVNDTGNPFTMRDWNLYDFSRRSPE